MHHDVRNGRRLALAVDIARDGAERQLVRQVGELWLLDGWRRRRAPAAAQQVLNLLL